MKKLKTLRKQTGYTLKELAEECKMSYVYISNLETGKKLNPSRSVLEKLANALNVSIDELLKEESVAEAVIQSQI